MSRTSEPTAKRRPWIRWGLIVLALVFLYQVLAGPRGLLKLSELRSQRNEIRLQIDSLERRKQELLAEKQRLLTDTAYLEKLARKELGMARPGERVYRFVSPTGGPKEPVDP
jgi:cell division protein FtsB